MIDPETSIPYLEREYLYMVSKADFIADFLDPANVDFRVTVTMGLTSSVTTEFMISDLFGPEMEKTLLAKLEELFRQKAEHLERQICEVRRSRLKMKCLDG